MDDALYAYVINIRLKIYQKHIVVTFIGTPRKYLPPLNIHSMWTITSRAFQYINIFVVKIKLDPSTFVLFHQEKHEFLVLFVTCIVKMCWQVLYSNILMGWSHQSIRMQIKILTFGSMVILIILVQRKKYTKLKSEHFQRVFWHSCRTVSLR